MVFLKINSVGIRILMGIFLEEDSLTSKRFTASSPINSECIFTVEREGNANFADGISLTLIIDISSGTFIPFSLKALRAPIARESLAT